MGIGIISTIALIVLGYIFVVISYFITGSAKNILLIIGLVFIAIGILLLYYLYYKKNSQLENSEKYGYHLEDLLGTQHQIVLNALKK